jgi:hypothetical protein
MHFATKQREEECVFCIGPTPALLHPSVLSDRELLVMRLTRTQDDVGLQQTDIVSAITIWTQSFPHLLIPRTSSTSER